MDAVVTALTSGITSTALFGALAALAPLVVVAVIVSFANTKLGKVVRGLGHGRAKI